MFFFLRMVAGWIRKMTKAFKDLSVFVSNYLKIILAIYNGLGFYASEKMSSNIFYTKYCVSDFINFQHLRFMTFSNSLHQIHGLVLCCVKINT